ncbi:tyrosine-type recombinase/integrase [Brucella sp. NBRC 12953]|uniref:tyrosine-type recombinase/integrase n=1 Tax=Brucella sp. NBRC 12953 TaxID=3075481 RepID=UPI003340FE4C
MHHAIDWPKAACGTVHCCSCWLAWDCGPVAHSGHVSTIVALALKRAGISDPPSSGARLLRHSAATSMLRSGATLEAIGAVLRHRSLDMTAHYAKVDVAMLEQVAQPWPGELPC